MRVEPESDPVWKERSKRFLKFIAVPRTWNELTAWTRRNKLLQGHIRNLIAYSDPLIRVTTVDGKKYWSCTNSTKERINDTDSASVDKHPK